MVLGWFVGSLVGGSVNLNHLLKHHSPAVLEKEKCKFLQKHPTVGNPYYHPASTLVHLVLRKWHARNLRADNTSAVVVMIDPVGEAVPDALEQLQQNRDLIYKDRNEFCASEFAQVSLEYHKWLTGVAGY